MNRTLRLALLLCLLVPTLASLRSPAFADEPAPAAGPQTHQEALRAQSTFAQPPPTGRCETWRRMQPGADRPHNLGEDVLRTLRDIIFPGLGGLIDFAKSAWGFISDAVRNGLGKALEHKWEELKATLAAFGGCAEERLDNLFRGLERMLTLDEFKLEEVGRFAETVRSSVTGLVGDLNRLVGVPTPINEIVANVVGLSLTGVTTAAVTPMALVHFGLRKAMEAIIPELILGAGRAAQAAQQAVAGTGKAPPQPSPELQAVLKFIRDVVAPVAGGIIGALVRPETKARLQSVLGKIAGVADKVQKGIETALSVTEKLRTGTYQGLEEAMQAHATIPTALTPADLDKMVVGLGEFAKQEIWAALDPVLRSLLGKAIGALSRLLDAPRSALVAAIGSIPYVGGILAGALNFGLGILVNVLTDLFTNQVMELAHRVLDHTLGGIANALARKLKENKDAPEAMGALAGFARMVGDVAGEVSKVAGAAGNAMRAPLGTAIAAALNELLLRGNVDERIRGVITGAVEALADRIGQPGFNLTSALTAVLERIAAPLADALTSAIDHTGMRQLAKGALTSLILTLARNGARDLMRNPMGFLTELAAQLIDQVKTPLATLIVGESGRAELRTAVATVIGAQGETLRREGFAGLLNLRQVLSRAFSQLRRPMAEELVAGVQDPQFRSILQAALDRQLALPEPTPRESTRPTSSTAPTTPASTATAADDGPPPQAAPPPPPPPEEPPPPPPPDEAPPAEAPPLPPPDAPPPAAP